MAAYHSVYVLIRAALASGVRMAEINRRPLSLSFPYATLNTGPIRELGAVVARYRLEYHGEKVSELPLEAIEGPDDRNRPPVLYLYDNLAPRHPLREDEEPRLCPFLPEDAIHFPMSRLFPFVDLRLPLLDTPASRLFLLPHLVILPLALSLFREVFVRDVRKDIRFLYKGIIIKHNKTEPTYTKTSLFLCEKRRFFMARTEKGVVATI